MASVMMVLFLLPQATRAALDMKQMVVVDRVVVVVVVELETKNSFGSRLPLPSKRGLGKDVRLKAEGNLRDSQQVTANGVQIFRGLERVGAVAFSDE